MKYDPIHSFRGYSQHNRQLIRDLSEATWAYKPRINWSGIGKALATIAMLAALYLFFIATP